MVFYSDSLEPWLEGISKTCMFENLIYNTLKRLFNIVYIKVPINPWVTHIFKIHFKD